MTEPRAETSGVVEGRRHFGLAAATTPSFSDLVLQESRP